MLASRTLPPLFRSPPPPPQPVVTFYNIPRRYERSARTTMTDVSSHAITKDDKSARHARGASKSYQPRSVSSPRATQHQKDMEPPSPALPSPSRMLTRKRAQSLNDEMDIDTRSSGDESLVDTRNLQNPSSTGSGELSGHVCLCQPEPKIPRPRNAFILYRQHHQHSIVASNPGLANPEISKIIGERWKSESEEQKKIWQDLATEEKNRHHEQYPDYRYQPRRSGKPGSLPATSATQHTTVDKYRCPRCGGRSIKTPTSPFLTTSGIPSLPPPNTSDNLTPTTRFLPVMNNLSLESPVIRRQRPGPSNLNNIQVPPGSAAEPSIYSPLSPDSKRRRYNYPANGRRPDSSGPYYPDSRRDSLPPIYPSQRTPPATATMAQPRTPGKGSTDLGLLVPHSHDQSRSVEAMVMSVKYDVKIKVLGRITPPLKEPGPSSPAVQVRGAIIAVEGDSLAAVNELTNWLNEFLSKDKIYHPRIAQPPRLPEDDKQEVKFEDYLELIKEWHGKSKEMISFITTPIPTSSCSNSTDSNASASAPSSTDSPKPIVILPTYQLHASNVYTSRIPITDAYSPTDHWQWMATLWRGTVGPDLTIYVRTKSSEEKEGEKAVVLDEGMRCLSVRNEGGRFEESALRRVGFEVGESIRGIGAKTG